MLKTRIIPTLLWKNEGLVKGIGFDSWRRVGTILPAIKVYNTRQVDELIIVDITASQEGRSPDINSVNDFSSECFVPLTMGGGIRCIKDVRDLLRAGADKICVNSITYEKPELITEIADMFGTQCVVVSIDAKKTETGDFECYSYSGTVPTGKVAEEWASTVEKLGGGEILVTSIENDGSMKGYNIDLIKRITENVAIPVIASGGAGNYEHMFQALKEGGASAVAAASIYHFTEQTPLEAKKYLKEKGVHTRR